MKNLICILIVTCCVFADHITPSCSSQEKCDEKTTQKMQQRKTLIQIKKSHKKNSSKKIFTQEKRAYNNHKPKHQTFHRAKKKYTPKLQSKKISKLVVSHHGMCNKVVPKQQCNVGCESDSSCKKQKDVHTKRKFHKTKCKNKAHKNVYTKYKKQQTKKTSLRKKPQQANYSIKFVGKKIKKKNIESIIKKLSRKASFSVIAVKQTHKGIVFDICSSSSTPVLAGSVIKSFFKKGIYAGVTKASGKEMTLRISPWSVYSS